MNTIITSITSGINLFVVFTAIVFMGVLIAYRGHNDFHARIKRFFMTMISKKIFAWFIATCFFSLSMLSEETWAWMTIGTFGLDVTQKYLGMKGKENAPDSRNYSD